MNLLIPTEYMEDAVSVDYARKVKEQVGILVISDGNIGDPDLAQQILEDNKLDFVGLGRPLLADPEWPNKTKANKKKTLFLAFDVCNVLIEFYSDSILRAV